MLPKCRLQHSLIADHVVVVMETIIGLNSKMSFQQNVPNHAVHLLRNKTQNTRNVLTVNKLKPEDETWAEFSTLDMRICTIRNRKTS